MKKSVVITTIVLIVIILAAGAAFWRWESLKKAEMAKQEELQKQEIEKLQVDQEGQYKDNGGRFKSKNANISFEYGSYDKFSEKYQKSNEGGFMVNFINENSAGVHFDIFSKDYEKGSPEYRDIYTFDLADKNNPVHNIFSKKENEVVIKRGDNIFQLIGYNNAECTEDVSSQLFYIFPDTSKFKYAVFYLGSFYEINNLAEILPTYVKERKDQSCRGLKADEFKKVFELISSGKVEPINNRLADSMKIIKSFEY